MVTDRRCSENSAEDGIGGGNNRLHRRSGSCGNYGITEVDVESGLNQSYSSQTSGPNLLNSSHGSMLLSDAIKEARKQQRNPVKVAEIKSGKSSAKAEPLYYPKWPQSGEAERSDFMAPLQAPWPALPPIEPQFRRHSTAAYLPTSVRHFIESQNR